MIARRPRTLRGVLAFLIGATTLSVLAPAPAAQAASSGVSVVITELSPTTLPKSGRLRLTGEVTNSGSKPWSAVQAYLLIRNAPFTNRSELAEQAAIDKGFAGTRIVDTGRFAELGDLAPGQTRTFTLSMPVDQLPITGTQGVYPIGVQILGTDSTGHRSTDAIARATTFLPRMPGKPKRASSTVVWPFLMPTTRGATGQLNDLDGLIATMTPGGRLRNRLDLATAAGPAARGVLVDPALISAADDVARNRRVSRKVTEAEQAIATAFRNDLVAISTDSSAWVLDYDRADVLAWVSDAASRQRLSGAVERATDTVVDQYKLSRNRMIWPTRDGVSNELLRTIRERGDDPVLVSSSSMPGWSSADGVMVGRSTPTGDIPLLVDDDISRGVPGAATPATLQQRVLASAALASLAGGERESIVVIAPSFDPGPAAEWSIRANYIAPRPLSAITRSGRYSGQIESGGAKPLSPMQIATADTAARSADTFRSAAVEQQAVDAAQAQSIADVLGVRWRSNRDAGQTAAQAAARRIAADLSAITVMAPPEVTLSSSAGGFPITISNDTDVAVRVGLQMESSNPALSFPDVKPIEIAAGERRTVTVDIDLKEQNATTVTTHLVTPDGERFGTADEFIVRSSRVGLVLWATMAAAGLFVVFALFRRFGRRRNSLAASPAGEPDE